MKGINKAIIVGTLGKDPETRYTASGAAITNISVATSEKWRDKQTGEQQEKTEWHRIVFFQRLAEVAGEFLSKGSQVYIEGQIRTRKWQDKDGQDRWSTEIHAREMQMLGSKGSSQQGQSQGQTGGFREPAQPQAAPQQSNAPQSQPTPADDSFVDDDIPF